MMTDDDDRRVRLQATTGLVLHDALSRLLRNLSRSVTGRVQR